MIVHANHLKPFENSQDSETVENARATEAEPQLRLAKGDRALKQSAIAKESKQARREIGLKNGKNGRKKKPSETRLKENEETPEATKSEAETKKKRGRPKKLKNENAEIITLKPKMNMTSNDQNEKRYN